MKRIPLIYIIIISILGCKSKAYDGNSIKVICFNNKPIEFIQMSDFVSSINYVPLETKSNCNINNITKIKFFGDSIIIFNQIGKDVARNILKDLIMAKTIKTFEKRGILIKFDSTFEDYILEKGYSAKFGVRNLERVFEKEVLTAISSLLFEKPDKTEICITAESGRVTIQ